MHGIAARKWYLGEYSNPHKALYGVAPLRRKTADCLKRRAVFRNLYLLAEMAGFYAVVAITAAYASVQWLSALTNLWRMNFRLAARQPGRMARITQQIHLVSNNKFVA